MNTNYKIQGIELNKDIKGKYIKLIEEVEERVLPRGFITEIISFDPDDGSINVVTKGGGNLWIFNYDLWKVEWADQPKQPKQPSRKKLKSIAEDLIQQFEYMETSRKTMKKSWKRLKV